MQKTEINPGRLKLELFCQGAQIDDSCDLIVDTRPVKRTRGGLGSGLDAILPNEVWVNIPIAEPFAQHSPFTIKKINNEYSLWDGNEKLCELKLPPRPDWYGKSVSSGKCVGEIGVMQGTYFAIYPSQLCEFWQMEPSKNCHFCSIGLCLGQTESEEKTIADVVQAVRIACKYEHITFVHFNTGFFQDNSALDLIIPYAEAAKKATGVLVGVQCPPSWDLKKYDRLRKVADHVSFCFELFDPEKFEEICPGKAEYFGRLADELSGDPWLESARELVSKYLGGKKAHPAQLIFYRAIMFCSQLWGRGRVSGEIVAGLESPDASIAAINFLSDLGVVTTACIFRPCIGTDLENILPPDADEMAPIFARLYESCIEKRIPFGLAPNIKTAMVHLPEEGQYLSHKSGPGISRRISKRIVKKSLEAALALRQGVCSIKNTTFVQ